jgi:hypothetical protein
MYLYFYGILFTLLSIGFYIYYLVNSSISSSSSKRIFHLVFSICSGWVFVLILLGTIDALERPSNIFIEFLYDLSLFIFPIIAFIGLEMILYGLFRDD